MRIWKEWYIGNPKNATLPYKAHVALSFENTRILWTEFGSAPLWTVGKIIWKKESPSWSRLHWGNSTWWCGQRGNVMVVIGRGRRPAVVLTQGQWTGIIPPGRGSCSGIIPSDDPCMAKFQEPKLVHHQWAAR
ncbi:hypothetical protein SAMN00768000_0711 [Sulfobacillus thermosulfidooxidans DSM 9293]|uniref:Uncharacterized protein n=1 Tax=Sulfobacillus thermosulfidooxidans (strain DSM 9293 / VKM B-1269 / AT-1) TaxID=929705 RepID=A0A1W1WAC5_SULTA|nr:hypothetical protein [Sulfobacillus thermosulfidooxidans]SMC02683.1 hypothetical protein SAMN00768000_0711 [Sulfobacillus thermosulfidooxidans DSM 9293]